MKDKKSLMRKGRQAYIGDIIGDLFTTGDYEVPDENEAWLAECRDMCRNGNPFPLMALQWPRFLVRNPDHYQYFEGDPDDKYNPVLRIDRFHRDIIKGFFDPSLSEIFVKGSTGSGKGFSISVATNLLYDVADVARIHLTSETWDHAKDNIFGEILDWRNNMMYPTPAQTSTTSFFTDERKYIKILNPKPTSGEAFSGRHSRQNVDFDFWDFEQADDGGTYYIFDEASAVRRLFYDNAMKNAKKLIAASNPRVVSGWFRDGFRQLEKEHKDEDKTGTCEGIKTTRLCVTAGGPQCTNVIHKRLKEPVSPVGGITIDGVEYNQGRMIPDEDFLKVRALVPGQMDLAQYMMIMSDPREHIRDCFGDGKFIKEDPEFQNILNSWIPRHLEEFNRLKGEIPVMYFAYDCARSESGDSSVLVAGSENGVSDMHDWKVPTYLQSAEKIIQIAESQYGIKLRNGQNPVVIDFGGGWGAGVAEHLQAKGVWVVEFHPSGTAKFFPKEYRNQRTEAYALLARRLSPKDFWHDKPFALPPDDMMIEELTAPHREYPEGDRTKFKLESKELVKEKIHRSPDKADAVSYLFYYIFEAHKYLQEMKRMQSNFVSSATILTDDERLEVENQAQGGAAAKPKKEGQTLVEFIQDVYGRKPKKTRPVQQIEDQKIPEGFEDLIR